MLRDLLDLQKLDLAIERCREREREIPKSKQKSEIQKMRLAAELDEREKVCRDLILEQRDLESEIEQKQSQAKKYDQQLFSVKKNEEYQALLHEIDLLKKQIGLKEERVIALLVALDDAEARLEEDKKRIEVERKDIDRQCAEIDAELAEAKVERAQLEKQREPLAKKVEPELLDRYVRIRGRRKSGPAVVPLNGRACSGCHMYVTPQVANEVLAGEQVLACNHCGRLLYHKGNVGEPMEDQEVL